MDCKPLAVCIVSVIDHRGLTPKKLGGDWAKSGYRALSAKNIKDGKLVQTESMKLVDEELYRRWMPQEIEEGDVFITSEAPFGEVLFWNSSEKLVLSQRVFGLKPNHNICDARYLYYWMKGPLFQGELRGRATGTTVIGLRQPELLKCGVALPSMDTQKRISAVLGAIDDKIESNAKLNGYLAEQCEGIAEHQTGDVVALASLCGLASERVDCREADIATYVSTESLLPAKMGKQTASSLPQAGKVTVYKAGDTLVSNIRPYFKKIWYANRSGTCSGDVLVFRANQPEHAGYLYSCLRQDRFFDYVMKGAKGTKMPRGDKKQMLTYEIVNSPSAAAIGAIQTALEQISIANKENDSLAALRDALLPKLMSGEIDVSKVDLTQLNSHLSKCSSGSCCILPVMAALPATK